MGIIDESNVVVQPLHIEWYKDKVAAMDMLRLDLVHPVVSGNKWYKLRLNMKHALESGFKNIVTFGGGFSNHLIATAFTAKMFGLNSVGIVRGKYPVLTPTLKACEEQGMELIFVSQEDYQNGSQWDNNKPAPEMGRERRNRAGAEAKMRAENSRRSIAPHSPLSFLPEWAKKLVAHFDEIFIIPEGGANEWGRAGAGLIERFVDHTYTHVAVSVGTGTTFIGLRNKIGLQQRLLGFAPMKQGAYLNGYINEHIEAGKMRAESEERKSVSHRSRYVSPLSFWQLFDDWHFGGFGKWNDDLIGFMNDFYRINHIPLDIVYTSKMMYGVQQMLFNDFFAKEDRILCIHTGGLQGNTSVQSMLNY